MSFGLRDEYALLREQGVVAAGRGQSVGPAVVDLTCPSCQTERLPSGTAPGMTASIVVDTEQDAPGSPTRRRARNRHRKRNILDRGRLVAFRRRWRGP